jgi:hypothetical protein
VVEMTAASHAPVAYPSRRRHLRIAESVPEEPRRSTVVAVILGLLVAATAFAVWEEVRVDQRDDTVATLETQVADGHRTIADLERQLAASSASASGLEGRVAFLERRLSTATTRIGTVAGRRDVLAGNLAAARDDLGVARQEAATVNAALVRLAGPPLADGTYAGVVNFVSTVGSQLGRPWTMGFVGIGERALVDGQGVLRVLPVSKDATVKFRSAIPDPPATYGFVECEELFYSTAPQYAAVHSWNTGYAVTLDGGRIVAITSLR